MVGSALNSTASAHMLPLATHCDLDGDLLVRSDGSLAGGFQWKMSPAGQ